MDRTWQQTFDAIEDAVWILDRDFRIVRSNLAASRLFGRDLDFIVGRPCWEIVHGSSGPVPDCPVVRMARSLRRESSEIPWGDRWLEVTAHPIVGADGVLVGAVHLVADVSGRHRAEEALRRSEEKFKHVFETANAGKSLTLPSGEVFVNKALADMLGYDREDLRDRTWQELTPPEDVAAVEAQVAPLLAGDADAVRFVKRYLHRDGSCVWADVSTVLRRDTGGRPLHFITTVIDITEQKRAEERLRQSEQRFANAFRASPAGMTITRIADGRFVDVNEAFLRMMEFTHDEVIGRTSTELGMWSPAERDEIIRRQVAAGGLQDCEMLARTKTGRAINLLFSSRPMEVDGQPHLVTTMIDLTERERAKRERADSEGRYRALFENMNAGFVLFEVVADGAGKPVDLLVLDANRGFETATGLRADEVTGRRLTEVLPGIENDAADWIGIYGRIALGGAPQQFEHGSDLLGHHYSVNAYRAGPGQCAVTFQDVSEHVRMRVEKVHLEQELMQAQKLESVGRLAGGVAHDFNNMLSVILGYGEAILCDLHEDDPLRAEVAEMVEAGRRSAGLTRQLLAFSRKQTLQPEVLDLNRVVSELERMLCRLIGEDVELVLELAPDVDRVMVDPGQLEQVIMNLVVNARDAMPAGGKLLIETASVDLDAAYGAAHVGVKPGRHVMLAISDTGSGMSSEVAERIFEPFFTTKDEGKGTGLGLATVYGIVKQSGGNIWVYSEAGRGTTFKVYFPVTEAALTAAPRPKAADAARGSGQHVLVVEDDESVRRFLEAVLPRLGYAATAVANGGEALLLIEEKGLVPDLVLTDVVMPRMNGRELVARLRRTRPDLKVLFMSGYTDNSIVRHGVLEPGTPFIQKPFAIRQLALKIAGELLGSD